MDLKLPPNFPQKTLFEGEGGSYKTWSSSNLANANVGGGKFVLKPRGFALPHHADSSKIGCASRQIVGINGKLVLDSKLEAGQLFVVPRFFTVAEVAGNEGMELLSITNSSWPSVKEFTTKESVWNVLSPVISQAALNVTPEFDEHFKSNIQKSSIIIPPPN